MPVDLAPIQGAAFPVAGLVGLAALVFEMWRERAQGMSAIGWLMAGLTLTANLEQMTIQFGGGALRASTNAGGVTTTEIVAPAPVVALSHLSWVFAGALAGVAIAAGFRLSRPLNGAGWAILLAALLSNLTALTNGTFAFSPRWVLMMVVFLAVAMLTPSFDAVRGGALGLCLVVIANYVLPLFNPAAAAKACSPGKCGLFGNLYNGATYNENALGLVCALGLPVLFFGLRHTRGLIVSLTVLMLLASGSRTSMVTGAVAVLFLAISLAWPSWWRISYRHATVALLLTIGAVSALVPFLGLSDGTFTGRAGLWRIGLQELSRDAGRVAFGLGPESWSRLYDVGVIDTASSYSIHNQFLSTLFISGVFGVFLLILALGAACVRNATSLRPFACMLLPALVTTITERPWSLERPDWLIWSLTILLAMSPPAPKPTPPLSPIEVAA